MISGFTELFGKKFIIGFFSPAVMFALVSLSLTSIFGQTNLDLLASISSPTSIWAASVGLFGIWIIGVILMTLNRILIRLLEGYGLLEKTPLLKWQRFRFKRLQKQISDIKKKRNTEKKEQGEVSPDTRKRYIKLLTRRRYNFPSNPGHILATSFGNVIRAFEVYSYEVYGLDSIPVWTRIIAVVPNAYRDILNDVKSRVNFAVNTFYLSIVFSLEYICYSVATKSTPCIWMPFAGLIVTWTAYRFSISSAKEWGEYVKSIFDLYRYDLLKQMGLAKPKTWEEERRAWEEICRSFLYWDKITLPRGLNTDIEKS